MNYSYHFPSPVIHYRLIRSNSHWNRPLKQPHSCRDPLRAVLITNSRRAVGSRAASGTLTSHKRHSRVYFWNRAHVVRECKQSALTSENMGSFLAKSTTRVMAGVMILVNSLKASRSTLSPSDVGATGDWPIFSGCKGGKKKKNVGS